MDWKTTNIKKLAFRKNYALHYYCKKTAKNCLLQLGMYLTTDSYLTIDLHWPMYLKASKVLALPKKLPFFSFLKVLPIKSYESIKIQIKLIQLQVNFEAVLVSTAPIQYAWYWCWSSWQNGSQFLIAFSHLQCVLANTFVAKTTRAPTTRNMAICNFTRQCLKLLEHLNQYVSECNASNARNAMCMC